MTGSNMCEGAGYICANILPAVVTSAQEDFRVKVGRKEARLVSIASAQKRRFPVSPKRVIYF